MNFILNIKRKFKKGIANLIKSFRKFMHKTYKTDITRVIIFKHY